MAEFDLLQSLQILALDAVVRPDWNAVYRQICREYSRKFHTPLHVVEELPHIDVLTHYYEDLYDGMDERERERLAYIVTETAEERLTREARETVELNSEAVSVASTLEKARRAMEATVRAVDSLGKLRARPNAKTVADLRTAETDDDALGANLGELLAKQPPAPAPRQPGAFTGPQPVDFQIGGEIPEDFDALGANLPPKPRKP